MSHHVVLNGDDGADAVPAQFVQDGDGVVIRPAVECDVSRRFPDGFFRIDGGRGTAFERVGGDEDLFLDGESRRQPFVTIRIAKTRAAALASPVISFPPPGSVAPRRRLQRCTRLIKARWISFGRAWSDR